MADSGFVLAFDHFAPPFRGTGPPSNRRNRPLFKPPLPGTLDSRFAARRYRLDEIGLLLAMAGLKTLTLRYFNLLGAFGWWWDSRVVKRRSVSEGTYRRRDLAVPLARLVDRLTGPPFGRSLLAVGEKPWW